MDDQLLVRIYDVGLGDCIYLRVPDRERCRHILIDCGNKYSSPDLLEAAVKDLETQLPAEPNGDGKRRLDLLVATHAHEDHVRGFDVEPFKNIRIERIWMSVAMKPDHDKATESRELHAVALRALSELRRAAPSSGLTALADSLYALSKSDALGALSTALPRANGIEPVYVHADTPENVTCFFADPAIRLRVLAPMEEIDRYYLGRAAEPLKRLASFEESAAERATAAGGGPDEPLNISAEDFARLKARLLNNALALALIDGHVVNNTSVVLLLEWRGRRLLFTGDAEVNLAREGGFREGAPNGSWNVMWETRREDLGKPLDFLKVGHHGSDNATPWTAETIAVPKDRGGGRKRHPVNEILDAILPLPGDGDAPAAAAAVSTHRTKSWKGIPNPLLMAELGKRVANVKLYDEAVFYAKEGRLDTQPHHVAPTTPQPQRTDLEGGHPIDFLFSAGTQSGP